MIIDFPETFQKFAPSLVRTGKWDATKTFMTEALRNSDVLDAIGSPVVGLRGTAASSAGGPAGEGVRRATGRRTCTGAKPYTGFEGTAFDAANVAFLAALQGLLGLAARRSRRTSSRSRARPGSRSRSCSSRQAIKLLLAGKEIDYEGAFSPVDFDRNGDIGSAVFEIWKYDGSGQDRHAEDGHVPRLMRQDVREGGGFEEAAAYSRAVRVGPYVAVSGTAARGTDGDALHRADCRAQTLAALQRASRRPAELGAPSADVLRTRLILAPGGRLAAALPTRTARLRRGRPGEHDLLRGGLIPAGGARRGRARASSRAAQVELDHLRVVQQLGAGPLDRVPAHVEHVAAVRERERAAGVLLDHHDPDPEPVDLEQLARRPCPSRSARARPRLVEEQQLGAGHERARERDELALAARERARALARPLARGAGRARARARPRRGAPPSGGTSALTCRFSAIVSDGKTLSGCGTKLSPRRVQEVGPQAPVTSSPRSGPTRRRGRRRARRPP